MQVEIAARASLQQGKAETPPPSPAAAASSSASEEAPLLPDGVVRRRAVYGRFAQRSGSFRREVGRAAAETFLLTRLTLILLRYLGSGPSSLPPMVEHHSRMENLSVLVLDFDPTSLLAISNTLEKVNFKVFPFQTELAALDFLKKGATKQEEIDLILAEVHVSTMASGTLANSELLNHITNELHVPFVSMSDNDNEEVISECMAIGACFHLPKSLITGSVNMLRQIVRQHKVTPEGQHLKGQTRSTKRDRLRLKAPDHSKKSDRLIWTVELEQKFLEAIEVLGDKFAVPRKILMQMNVKNLSVRQVASHLQKHRSQAKAQLKGQSQQNASNKTVSELIRSAHNAFTTVSITPQLEGQSQQNASNKTVSELIRLAHNASTTVSTTPQLEGQSQQNASNKTVSELIRSVHNASTNVSITPQLEGQSQQNASNKTVSELIKSAHNASKAYSYTGTPGIFRDDTRSVWDKYHKSLQNDLSNRRRWQSSVKSKDVARYEGISSESPKTAAEIGNGVPFESSGSNSLLTSSLGQTGKNNLTESAVTDPSDGWLHLQGKGALLNDTNKSSSAQMYLTSPANDMGKMNTEMLQVDEAWNDALIFRPQRSLVSIVEPITQEATVEDTPVPDPVMQFAETQEAAVGDAPVPDHVMQFAQTQEAAVGDAPVHDHVMQLAQTQEAAVGDAPVHGHVMQFAQDDVYWSASPSLGNYYDVLW